MIAVTPAGNITPNEFCNIAWFAMQPQVSYTIFALIEYSTHSSQC
jgi:hypothetical protein